VHDWIGRIFRRGDLMPLIHSREILENDLQRLTVREMRMRMRMRMAQEVRLASR